MCWPLAGKHLIALSSAICRIPSGPDAIDRLKAAVEIHGVQVASELKVRLPFDDPDALRLYEACGAMRLPITIHLDYPIDHGRGAYPRPNWWYGGSLDALERAVAACPQTVFIGHAPWILGPYFRGRSLRQRELSERSGAAEWTLGPDDAPVPQPIRRSVGPGRVCGRCNETGTSGAIFSSNFRTNCSLVGTTLTLS